MAAWVTLAGATERVGSSTPRDEPITPVPRSVGEDPKRVALGRRLFNERLLSADRSVSCASCHPLDRGATDGRQHTMQIGDARYLRDTPTVLNLVFNIAYNWDGTAATLEEVIHNVVKSPRRFNTTLDDIVAKLRADAQYASEFRFAYADGLAPANVVDALAAYQRSLVTPDSRFDRYLRGDAGALTGDELKGYELFKSVGCVACHQGTAVGGNLYQRFGIFKPDPPRPGDADPGRFRLTKQARDLGVFRVPSLRNVELTAPYFHDGSAATLDEAVDTMAKVQLNRRLEAAQTRAIVRFLRTLTGELDGRPLATPAGPPGPEATRR